MLSFCVNIHDAFLFTINTFVSLFTPISYEFMLKLFNMNFILIRINIRWHYISDLKMRLTQASFYFISSVTTKKKISTSSTCYNTNTKRKTSAKIFSYITIHMHAAFVPLYIDIHIHINNIYIFFTEKKIIIIKKNLYEKKNHNSQNW